MTNLQDNLQDLQAVFAKKLNVSRKGFTAEINLCKIKFLANYIAKLNPRQIYPLKGLGKSSTLRPLLIKNYVKLRN